LQQRKLYGKSVKEIDKEKAKEMVGKGVEVSGCGIG
jgi:hypothetical protein